MSQAMYPEPPTRPAADPNRLDPTGGRFDESTDVRDVSVGDLVGEVLTDVSTLVRQEIALAKAEVQHEAKRAGKGAGMLGGAGLAGYFTALFLSLTLMFLLDLILPLWLAALIVTALWGIGAYVLYSRGRKELASVNPKPEQTIESVKEDVQWAKTQSR